MEVKVSMLIMSFLSDSQELLFDSLMAFDVNNRLNFVKYLVLKYKDTSVSVDPEAELTEYLLKYPDKGWNH